MVAGAYRVDPSGRMGDPLFARMLCMMIVVRQQTFPSFACLFLYLFVFFVCLFAFAAKTEQFKLWSLLTTNRMSTSDF